MRRIAPLLALACLLLVLPGCLKAPSDPMPTANSLCRQFEPLPLSSLPEKFAGISPTHAVRFDIFRCVGTEWQTIGGPAYVSVHADAQPYVPGGATRTGVNYPWPYENLAAPTPWQLPIEVAWNVASVIRVTARTSAVLDAGEMISCWMVTRDGRTMPGSQTTKIATSRGQRVETTCNAELYP